MNPFEGLACSHSSHAELEGFYKGVNRTKLAQTWPVEMCRRIVEGILQIIREIKKAIIHRSLSDKGGDSRLYYQADKGGDRIQDMIDKELANAREDHDTDEAITQKS